MYKCKHFKIYELVDKCTHDLWGEDSWQFFDTNSLQMIDDLCSCRHYNRAK